MIGSRVGRRTPSSCLCATIALALLWSTSPLEAQPKSPVAIVERAPDDLSVKELQYLQVGTKISLGAQSTIVIGYLTSCLRETITGGAIEIGEISSNVSGGTVFREEVKCDADYGEVVDLEASESGAIVFRNLGKNSTTKTIYSTTPLFTLPPEHGDQQIEIFPKDRPDLAFVLKPVGSVLDLAVLRTSLTPGSSYEARAGPLSRSFSIESKSKEGGPLLGRLVVF